MELWPLLSETIRQDWDPGDLADGSRVRRSVAALGVRLGPPHIAVPLLETLLAAGRETADPEMALLNLERWSAALPSPAGTFGLLRDDPRLLADLLTIFGASQYLADILIRDPWLYSLFTEPAGPRELPDYEAAIRHALAALHRPESRTDALRRIKRREFLRIGWRDLARGAPLEETVGEISDLAEALIAGAFQLAREAVDARFPTAAAEVRLAVLALGKLGARELNYSSDVDLVFVMEGPEPLGETHRRYANRLAEATVRELAAETGEGRCFRVDLRLRPEGRSGVLVRSLSAYRTYYDRWAETWERQALIKVRPVAGDPELGEGFAALARSVAYRRLQGATLLEDVREMRGAVERKLEASGGLDGHVKEGRGTIREVEFPVQVLQLLFGAEHPALQVRDTLTALRRLREADLLTAGEAATFEAGYRFFRVVEHRLQLLNDLPVRRLPAEPRDRLRLARSVPDPGAPRTDQREGPVAFSSVAAFQAAYSELAERVHALAEAIHHRLGADAGTQDPLREALVSADSAEGAAFLARELRSRGFPDVREAVEGLVRLAAGGFDTRHPAAIRRLFADVAPALLAACEASADPSLALAGMADLADRKLLHRAFYQLLRERPLDLDALCRVAGTAPAAWQTVLRFPELSEIVIDEELVRRLPAKGELAEVLRERLAAAGSFEHGLSVLRRYKLREWVRAAARHVLHAVPVEVETAEWSEVAEVLVEAALELSLSRLRAQGRWLHSDAAGLAVLALGRFGGRDLHFASDLDLLYVYDSTPGVAPAAYELVARTLGDVLTRVCDEGRLFETDLRLRPEGRQGAQVASLEAMRRYYGLEGRAQTWEFQALTRARFIAGNSTAAATLLDQLAPRVYRNPIPETWRAEIRQMRHRMEHERVGEAERDRHLKLGPGGLADIEFLVQYLQLHHGVAEPSLRTTSTLEALERLSVLGHLTSSDAAGLREAFRFLTRLRQSLTLLATPLGPDLLPDPSREPRTALAAARSMGSNDARELDAAFREWTGRVRAIFDSQMGDHSR